MSYIVFHHVSKYINIYHADSYPTSEVDYIWKNVDVMDDTMTEFKLKGTTKRKEVYQYSTGDLKLVL